MPSGVILGVNSEGHRHLINSKLQISRWWKAIGPRFEVNNNRYRNSERWRKAYELHDIRFDWKTIDAGNMHIDVRGNSRLSRLCPSHVLRLRGRLMMPVDSLFGGFLVARVVFGSLSTLAFRVVVER